MVPVRLGSVSKCEQDCSRVLVWGGHGRLRGPPCETGPLEKEVISLLVIYMLGALYALIWLASCFPFGVPVFHSFNKCILKNDRHLGIFQQGRLAEGFSMTCNWAAAKVFCHQAGRVIEHGLLWATCNNAMVALVELEGPAGTPVVSHVLCRGCKISTELIGSPSHPPRPLPPP